MPKNGIEENRPNPPDFVSLQLRTPLAIIQRLHTCKYPTHQPSQNIKTSQDSPFVISRIPSQS